METLKINFDIFTSVASTLLLYTDVHGEDNQIGSALSHLDVAHLRCKNGDRSSSVHFVSGSDDENHRCIVAFLGRNLFSGMKDKMSLTTNALVLQTLKSDRIGSFSIFRSEKDLLRTFHAHLTQLQFELPLERFRRRAIRSFAAKTS